MAYDETLADRVRAAAAVLTGDVTERTMFGGLAFMLNGHMFAGVVGEDLPSLQPCSPSADSTSTSRTPRAKQRHHPGPRRRGGVIEPACTGLRLIKPVYQLAASPATVSGTPPNSPVSVRWPPWPTAQPNSFCASASIAYR
jgi:hypothetical protein